MEDVSPNRDAALRSWKPYGYCAAALIGVATFAVFGSHGLSFFVAAGLFFFTTWLDTLRHAVAGQMVELATARAYLRAGQQGAARQLAVALAGRARARRVRNGALQTVAWASLNEGLPERAKEALDHIQPGNQIDLYCFAVVEKALGKTRLAIEALELEPSPSCESSMFLVDLHVFQGDLERAIHAGLTRRHVLGADNCRTILRAAIDAWTLAPAVALAVQLFEDTGAVEDASTVLRILAYQRDFAVLESTTDHIIGRLLVDGRGRDVRSLLTNLAADSTLPSGACRDFSAKLHALQF